MKKLLKSFLPVSVWNILRAVKMYLRILKARMKIFMSIPLKRKNTKIRFEIHIAEHCNLNCASCNNFSCIAEPEFVSTEEFRRDFERLGELFGHECDRIHLLGGEPLLNPEINTLIKIARDNFPKGSINIFTNGILLSQKEADFWQACHDNNIGILISAYPIKIDTETIHSLADKFGVNVSWAWNQNAHERDTFHVAAINLAGDGDIVGNFAVCDRANTCVVLSHGRLFPCTFAPHVRHFNKRFNQNVAITDADSIDIYSDTDADKILQRLTEPIPACRYCVITTPSREFKWHRTSMDINEWL